MWKKTEGDEPQPQFTPQPQTATPPRSPAPKAVDRALIGPSIFIKGDLVGEEDLVIEGRIEGKIEFKQNNVTIGKNGRVRADIFGKLISIEGEVQGNLHGEEQVLLRQSSNVRGNLTAPRVTLEDGCRFKGSIDMSPKEAPEVRASQAAQADALVYKSPRPEKNGEAGKPASPVLESDRGGSRK